jgi:hypothetical protein
VCGPSGGDKWNQDSFGAFKVVVDANKNRKVARDGSRFLYDDSVDSIIRMLWPDRVADYAQVDVDRERALLSVLVMYNVLGRYSCLITPCRHPLVSSQFKHPRCIQGSTYFTVDDNQSQWYAECRLEDVAAGQHFAVGVQGDRLRDPSAANRGMAAG